MDFGHRDNHNIWTSTHSDWADVGWVGSER